MLLPPEWEVQKELFQRKATFKFIPFQNHGSSEVILDHGQIAKGVAWAESAQPAADRPPEIATGDDPETGHGVGGFGEDVDRGVVLVFHGFHLHVHQHL